MRENVFGPRRGDNFRLFKLTDAFLADYVNRDVEWGPLGYVTFKRTYARPVEGGGTEEWWQTCARVVSGTFTAQKWHCANIGVFWDNRKAQKSAQEMYDRMFSFKWVPPGRGIWNMGTSNVYRKGGACLNNCGFVTTANIKHDFADPFTWMMDMLMVGVGVGFDTEGKDSVYVREPTIVDKTFVVADTREGWISAVREILSQATSKPTRIPRAFDCSGVRKKGALLSSGGVASGPGPLLALLVDLVELLWPGAVTETSGDVLEILLVEGTQVVTSSTIVDISTLIAKCVVSGGIRRSALLGLGDIEDEEFLNLKVGGHRAEYNRWASNNSITTHDGDHPDFSKLLPTLQSGGGSGIFWVDTARKYGRIKDGVTNKDERIVGVNPCGEIGLESKELCNVVETFPSRHDSPEDYRRTLKFAYLYAKTVSLIPTHDLSTNAVLLRNRRIGTSMSGIQEAIVRFGVPTFRDGFCDAGYVSLVGWDEVYSNWLCVPRSIKLTTVKPSGTTSLLPGVTAGIHFPHSKWQVRRIRIADTSPLLDTLRGAGVHLEPAVRETNTVVASFPLEKKLFDKGKADVTVWEQFSMAALMQTYWADNQVSVTITFHRHELDDIPRCLELFGPALKGVSFLPNMDHGYVQPPLEEITEEEYIEMANKVGAIRLTGDAHDTDEVFCNGDSCTI